MRMRRSASAALSFRRILCRFDRHIDHCGEHSQARCSGKKVNVVNGLWLPPRDAASASLSMPGSAWAILRKRAFTLCPAFADVSINMMFKSFARFSPSSGVTCLLGRGGGDKGREA
jgi:hypothetical protein